MSKTAVTKYDLILRMRKYDFIAMASDNQIIGCYTSILGSNRSELRWYVNEKLAIYWWKKGETKIKYEFEVDKSEL